MPSTYTVNLGIEKPATGEQSGTWGDTTNVNFDIIDQAVNGSERVTLTSAGTSGSPNDLNIVNGSTTSSEGRNKWIEIYSASDLGGSAYVRLVPNDAEKILFIRNSLAGSQSVLLFQGTYNASNDLEIPAGVDMVVKFDGAGASATVTDVFTKLRATEITTPTLTAGTADINGGSVDGATVGAASASTGAFTTLTASTSLNIAASTTVDGVLDEDNMASDSATKLATQQSIKAYVDSQVGTVDTLAEILANGNTSGANNLIIDNGQALTSNTINETTAGSGVTIDSVLLKDDGVNATNLEITNIKANDGTAAATIANSTGNFTITNFISNSVDIGGGAIDGTVIGGSTAAAGTFTTGQFNTSLNVDGTVTADGLTVDKTATISTTDYYASSTFSSTLKGAATNTKAALLLNSISSSGQNAFASLHSEPVADFRSSLIGTYSADGSGAGYFAINQFIPTSSTTAERLRIDSSGTLITKGAAVFNEDSADADFRVESDTNTHMLFVDAGNSHLGIGESAPSELIHATQNGGDAVLLLENTGSSATDDANIQLKTTLGTFTVQNDRSIGTSGALTFAGNTSNNIVIDHDTGQVGLGTNAPEAMLHLDGTTPYIRFTRSGTPTWEIRNNNHATGYGLSFYSVTDSRQLASFQQDEAVFNEDSADIDFRVESNSYTHMLFVDAGTDRVHIGGSNVGDGELNVNDMIRISGAAPELRIDIGSSGYYLQLTEEYSFPKSIGHIRSVANTSYEGQLQFSANAGGGAYRELARMDYNDGTTFNETSADIDFRVESDSNTHMLFIDASANNIAINNSSAGATLDVNGNMKYRYLRPEAAGSHSSSSDVWWQWGTILFSGSETAKLTVQGTQSYSAGGSIAGETEIFLRGNNGLTTLNGYFAGKSMGNVPVFDVAWKNTGTNNEYLIYLRLSSFAAFDYTMQTSGAWTESISSTGSTSTPAGATLLLATRHDWYQNDIVLSHYNNATVINESGVDRDFRVESDSNAYALLVDAGGDFVAMGNTTKTPVSNYADQHGFGFDAQTGATQIASDGIPLELGRTTTGGANGLFIQMRQQSNVVGVIGNYNGVPYIGYGGGTGGGIMFNGQSIEPTALGATRSDGTNDIGSTNYRWQNAYLSGSVYLGGTASANALDYYEEGTWTPTLTTTGTAPTGISYTHRSGSYTRIGNVVYIRFGFLLSNVTTAGSGEFKLTGLPFTAENFGGYQEPNFAVKGGGFANASTITDGVFGFFVNSTSNIQFRISDNSDTVLPASEMTSSLFMGGEGFYFVP